MQWNLLSPCHGLATSSVWNFAYFYNNKKFNIIFECQIYTKRNISYKTASTLFVHFYWTVLSICVWASLDISFSQNSLRMTPVWVVYLFSFWLPCRLCLLTLKVEKESSQKERHRAVSVTELRHQDHDITPFVYLYMWWHPFFSYVL